MQRPSFLHFFRLPRVLVRSGCYNKRPQTGWLINNRNLFLTVLEAISPKSGCQCGWVRALFWASGFSLCPHVAEGTRELCGVSFIRTLIPFMRAPPSWPKHLPKASPPSTITLGISISTYEFGGDTNVQTIAPWLHQMMPQLLSLRLYLPFSSLQI